MSFIRRHRLTLASGVVAVVAAGSLITVALQSPGYPTRHVNLNDGGIWASSDADNDFGRYNAPAATIDAAFNPPGASTGTATVDVRQDDAAVVAWDQGAGVLYPVNVITAKAIDTGKIAVSSAEQVELNDGTLAILDPATGKVWATRVDLDQGIEDLGAIAPNTDPIASVGPPATGARAGQQAGLAVGSDGTVHAVSSSGKVATIAPTHTGLAKPVYSSLGQTFGGVQATAVGTQLIVFEPATGQLIGPSGHLAKVDGDPSAMVQAPSGVGATVIVATSKALFAVPLAGGAARSLFAGAAGAPAAPTWLGTNVYAAWRGNPGIYRVSRNGAPAVAGNLKDLTALQNPVFRVNRGAIELNDLSSGDIYDLETGQKFDTWNRANPPKDSQAISQNPSSASSGSQAQPPKANPETWGVRPGRATVLHLLDGASDPQGSIMSIGSVTAASAGTLTLAPDRQTADITLPAGGGSAQFTYSVTDSNGLTSPPAVVTVNVHPDGQNTEPRVRANFKVPPAVSVAAGGSISLPVLGDWRDDDGDPVILLGASASAGSVTTTPDGRLGYRAPATGGSQTITYQVTDGVAGYPPVSRTVGVNVLSPTSTTPVAATAEPDVVSGVVGQPIQIRPLDNDLPGADPIHPDAALTLAGPVATPAGATVATDTGTGIVTVTATKPGPVALSYQAAYGAAPFAKGAMLVNVAAASNGQAPSVEPDDAVLHGSAPDLVDVLANDFDPSGDLLVVQRAQAVTGGGQLQIAIVQGRWLRISALVPQLNPPTQIVHYVVSDGVTAPVTGTVTVTQLAAPAHDTPVPQDDYATVRQGDSVTVPVLDNDTDPGGDPITLVQSVDGKSPGQLVVSSTSGATGDLGRAYVAGNLVRYAAPATVTAEQRVMIDYVAEDPAGDSATGHAYVTITPAVSPTNPDLAPAPQPLEARIVAGDTTTIVVPTSDVDPDGDSVTVTGFDATAAQLTKGRITAIGANSITYQAFPAVNNAGTDSFSYQVTDPSGKVGRSTVRIAVVPPGDPQPPVAVDDQVIAAPNAKLDVNVLANDVMSSTAAIDPLSKTDPGGAGSPTLGPSTGFIHVTAPADPRKPVVVPYSLSDGVNTSDVATLTVRSQTGYTAPPVANDAFALLPGPATTVTVDVLSKDYDPQGLPLRIDRVSLPTARISGDNVILPVGRQAQTVAYEIKNSQGGTAMAVIYVPGSGVGGPMAKPGQTISVPAGGSKTIDIAGYVTDPSGKVVRLTTSDQIFAAPPFGLKVTNSGSDKLVLTAVGKYAGPASITFQVTDGPSATTGLRAMITVPVQVGAPVPVLRCPSDPLTLVEGGPDLRIDVATLCHVWVADSSTLDGLKFSVASQTNNAVSVSAGSHALVARADSSARPNVTTAVSIGVVGASAQTSTLNFVVLPAPLETVAPVVIDGFQDGKTAQINLAGYVSSPLRSPTVSIVRVTEQEPAAGTTVSTNGSSVSIKPGPKVVGTIHFAVVLTDQPGHADRQATGSITLNVLNRPDPPTGVAVGLTVENAQVRLSWTAPANNGSPITSYRVGYSGGSQSCASSPCEITRLTDGRAYRFTVQAINAVGTSDASAPSGPGTPDRLPTAVGQLVKANPLDGRLTLTWTRPVYQGTPVEKYLVSWGGGHVQTVGAGATSYTATGLDNDAVNTFTVVAYNHLGAGAPATVTGESSGRPARPAAPTFTATNDTANGDRVVVLNWAPVDRNGTGPTTYTVTRTGGGANKTLTCADPTATRCTDSGIALNDTTYTYYVTAANANAQQVPAAHTSAAGAATSMEASATPNPITDVSTQVTAGTADGVVPVTFRAGNSNGKYTQISCTYSGGACGSTGQLSPSAQSVSMNLNLPVGATTTFKLVDCNGSAGSDSQAGSSCNSGTSASATTNAPPNPPQGGACASDDGTTATFTWSAPSTLHGRPVSKYDLSGAVSQSGYGGTSAELGVAKDSAAHTLTVVAVDSAGERSGSSISITCTDPAAPVVPTVKVSHGNHCTAAGCPQCGTSCDFVHVETANFSGNVTCTFDASGPGGSGGMLPETWGPNQSRDAHAYYGYPGATVTVTCGGVSGSVVW
jgi:hypothetical protein